MLMFASIGIEGGAGLAKKQQISYHWLHPIDVSSRRSPAVSYLSLTKSNVTLRHSLCHMSLLACLSIE